MRIKIKQIKKDDIGKQITIKGWIRSARHQKKFSFLAVNDGSTLHHLQIIADKDTQNYNDLISKLNNGASVVIEGKVVKSLGKGQTIELKANKIEILGECNPEEYPLQKKKHSFEFLRTIAHLRPRTNTIGAIARIRNALAFATHKFFQDQGFLYLNTPIITGADCEGAGEMFHVSTINPEKVPFTKNKKVDYTKDFFGKAAYLTVSGQLEAEIYACALSDVYTFGPTFRAENSNTSRHLAEFWMIEPEMAFADLNDDMDCAENYLKYCIGYVFENCSEDLKFFDKFISNNLIKQLQSIVQNKFERLDYTKAIKILQDSNQKFEFPVKWGIDLQSEHEKYLTEKYFKKPVILINYPKEIKAFYMKLNEDNKTVAAMDVLVPNIGEIIGGSQREDKLKILEKRLEEMNLKKEDYWWYLELRKFGSVPHSGFGLGFERLVMLVTGMENVRDVIPFPRTPGNLEF